MGVKRITRCRICWNKNLVTVVDLGEQYLSGKFPKIEEPEPLKAPLELVRCTGKNCCGLVQLAHNVPLDELYGPGYGYLSGLNRTMKHHLEEIVYKATHLVELKSNDIVLDIGCNDGTLLSFYDKGLWRIGMDHEHFKKYYRNSHVIFIPEFFTAGAFLPDEKAKIVTSIAMFYDLEAPNKFVGDIKSILHKDGIWVLEQSYLPSMLLSNAFDTICHEHLEYYCLNQIKWLCDKHGLKIFHYELNDSNGGSFCVYVCHKDSQRRGISDCVGVNLDFKRFNRNIQEIKQKLVGFLKEEQLKDKCIHVYGASTKGNVLLQYFGIDHKLIDYAADCNPDKWVHSTPGTKIHIISEQESKDIGPDYYLVLPWHFRSQFIEQEKEYLMNGGRLIFPLPYPEMICMEDKTIVTRQI